MFFSVLVRIRAVMFGCMTGHANSGTMNLWSILSKTKTILFQDIFLFPNFYSWLWLYYPSKGSNSHSFGSSEADRVLKSKICSTFLLPKDYMQKKSRTWITGYCMNLILKPNRRFDRFFPLYKLRYGGLVYSRK